MQFKATFVAASLLASLAAALVLPQPVHAQAKKPATYKQTALPKDLIDRRSPKRSKLQQELPGILRGDTPLDEAGKQTINEWFVTIQFAEITHLDNLDKLAAWRQNLRKRYFRDMKPSEPVLAYLNEITLASMIKIANDTGFHPAVRHNAMLVIGELNKTEPVAGAAPKPAVPLDAALTAKGGLLDSAEDATMHPAVRAAALVGILTHAETKLPPGTEATIQTKMVSILKEKPTDTLPSEALGWLKTRAADVCGTLGTVGAGNAVVTELSNTLNNPKNSVSVRCAAANALGKLKAVTGVNLPEVAAGLGNLHLDAMRQELDRAAAAGDAVSPREIHVHAACIQSALAGDGKTGGIVKLSKDGPEKPVLAGLAKNVTEVLALVPDENAQPAEGVKSAADSLEKLLADNKILKSKPRAETAPAADAATPDGVTEPAAADAKATDAKTPAKAADAPAAKK
jgi:hypothetical protein